MKEGAVLILSLIGSGGCVAFFVVMAEFVFVQRTSSLSLTIAGVLKEVLTIFMSMVRPRHIDTRSSSSMNTWAFSLLSALLAPSAASSATLSYGQTQTSTFDIMCETGSISKFK